MAARKYVRLAPAFALALTALSVLVSVPGRAAAMDFHLRSISTDGCRAHCPRVIVAEGQITNSTPDDFLAFLRENIGDRDMRTVVLLNSQGGYVVASMELGQMFRRIGAATVVGNQCLSACVYAFMGGVKRVAPRGTSLGIHRMFANMAEGMFNEETHRVYDDGSMAAMLMRYSARMGVSRDLIRFAERIPSGKLHYVTPPEMARWRLASRGF
ncbi:hypothetical protein [Rhodoblastus sp.]|uniref:COG3904 family protein n=1 Tax=Rhodoblastus sp. TaxID=1962975 RepID=UPI0026244332|nr:hypothetical protein [Rhodoblastus sp.]